MVSEFLLGHLKCHFFVPENGHFWQKCPSLVPKNTASVLSHSSKLKLEQRRAFAPSLYGKSDLSKIFAAFQFKVLSGRMGGRRRGVPPAAASPGGRGRGVPPAQAPPIGRGPGVPPGWLFSSCTKMVCLIFFF